MNEKHLTAYLWDDAPTALKARVAHGTRTPQMLWVVPARFLSRAKRHLLPPAMAPFLEGYTGPLWGYIERWHQSDGSLLIVMFRGNAVTDTP